MSFIQHPETQQNQTSETLRTFGGSEKILLIANLPERQLAEPFFERNYFDIHSATRTSDAIEEIMKDDFEAIIFDTSLPDFAITTFYSIVEKVRPHLLRRFIFLMDTNTDKWTEEFIERVDGLKVWRPIDLRELFQMVEIVLGKNVETAPVSS